MSGDNKLDELIQRFDPDEPDLSEEQIKVVTQLRDYLTEHRGLTCEIIPALDNASDALQRLFDKEDFAEGNEDAKKHHKNRLRRLIANIEEIIQLEEAREKETA